MVATDCATELEDWNFPMYLGSKNEWMRRPAEVVGSVVSPLCERSDEI